MRITILSDRQSWKNAAICALAGRLRKKGHRVTCLHKAESVAPGDLLFILGFFKIVPSQVLQRSKNNLVVHESALPKGRGWSPVTWLVLDGATKIPLTLFEAVEKVDAGRIYLRGAVSLNGNELLPEIHEKVARGMMLLCERFVSACPSILMKGRPQKGKPSFYPKRAPADSRLDPKKPLATQFNLLRTVHNETYPAFFTLRGSSYILKIEKKSD